MALRPDPLLAGLARGPDGTLALAAPAPATGTPPLSMTLIDADTGLAWSLQQIADGMAGLFEPV